MPADLITEFLTYADVELGLAPATLVAYRNDLESLSRFIADAGIILAAVDVNALASYLRTMMQSGLSSATVVRRIASLVTFYDYLRGRGLIQQNPAKLLDLPKLGHKLPDVLSRELMGKLLGSINPADRFALRDIAILETFYAAGLRVSELIGLDIADWYPHLRMVKVRGKGSKDRVAPVHARAAEAIESYLTSLRPGLAAVESVRHRVTDALFLSRSGLPLTRMAVWRIVRKASNWAGIRPIHPHTLRHTMASHLLSGGANLRVIQEILGHEQVNTTQRYTQVDLEHLKRMHKLHPRQ